MLIFDRSVEFRLMELTHSIEQLQQDIVELKGKVVHGLKTVGELNAKGFCEIGCFGDPAGSLDEPRA